MPLTLGAALLFSSRAGSDMWLLSRNSNVHQDWGRTIGVCVCSLVVLVGFVEFYYLGQTSGLRCRSYF